MHYDNMFKAVPMPSPFYVPRGSGRHVVVELTVRFIMTLESYTDNEEAINAALNRRCVSELTEHALTSTDECLCPGNFARYVREA